MIDLLIRNGRIADGSGKSSISVDVAVENGKIVAVGDYLVGQAEKAIDADGLVVAPGFIDHHSHSDLGIVGEHRLTTISSRASRRSWPGRAFPRSPLKETQVSSTLSSTSSWKTTAPSRWRKTAVQG
jgi:predicted amidohydrolase YtcJ